VEDLHRGRRAVGPVREEDARHPADAEHALDAPAAGDQCAYALLGLAFVIVHGAREVSEVSLS